MMFRPQEYQDTTTAWKKLRYFHFLVLWRECSCSNRGLLNYFEGSRLPAMSLSIPHFHRRPANEGPVTSATSSKSQIFFPAEPTHRFVWMEHTRLLLVHHHHHHHHHHFSFSSSAAAASSSKPASSCNKGKRKKCLMLDHVIHDGIQTLVLPSLGPTSYRMYRKWREIGFCGPFFNESTNSCHFLHKKNS